MKRFEISIGKTKPIEVAKTVKTKMQDCPNCNGTGSIGKKECIACMGHRTRPLPI